MAKKEFAFSTRLRVRWAEVDQQGIVFNGHYMTYFDVGVTEYYRAIGITYTGPLNESGTDLYLKKAELEYHASAQYDDFIDIYVRVRKIGNSSFEFAIENYRDDLLLVSGALVYVNAEPESRRSVKVPKFFRDAIISFERITPK